ncbi:hypothetical protein Bhyg_13792 [Pseudolycoriella hygida]|uniref:Uncharacterized protein n=1 Tax=Pseudolycoriella hygida TaxID=35572 RepID=A0A9Q0MNJ1_9DIPT|nr:hypothetical protein Bhyg_13792 [Pseudolycoriella hygida]
MELKINVNKYAPDDAGDDESHWQDRVSSGFDRLVAFASTELTKSRRSIEEAAASPDSGINHSSSDCRTFLSSSSSSSQLDLPPNTHRATMVPIIKSSPAEVLDSPPLSEAELPRTPSPSTSPSMMYTGKPIPQQHVSDNHLKIPLKYQRQSKSSSHHQKHYKKKFRERTWEYDCDESVGSDAVYTQEADLLTHHKSKFRPKGKDWDWRSENYRSHDSDQIC